MCLHEEKFRRGLRSLLKKFHLLGIAGWSLLLIRALRKSEYRLQISTIIHTRLIHWQRFKQYQQKYRYVLRASIGSKENTKKKALIGGIGFPQVEIELGLIKALEIAGYEPVVLIEPGHGNLKYYRMAGIKEFIFLDQFTKSFDPEAAVAALEHFRSIKELLTFEYSGAQVGKVTVSTALRKLRTSSLDLRSAQDRQVIKEFLSDSMAAADASLSILRQLHPDLAFIYDGVYSPKGELFDVCLANGTDVIIWESAHRSNTLMFKRYSIETRDEHYSSLSEQSWRMLQQMVWTDSMRRDLRRELHDTYANGDWYSSAGTQFNKRFVDVEEIQKRIGLDPSKKTAVIFPHIFWDGSLNSGSDFFLNYEDWLIKTVLAASLNTQVNWVVKIHPAHIFKSTTGFYQQDEPLEALVLRKNIGELPAHIFLLPANSDICTFSLFSLMDYCLTVRGTVGIEAASFGIPVLTAGTGRYDRKGFTIDSASQEEYLNRLFRIQEIPRLSPAQKELAERYAYGLFILRPFPLTSIRFDYQNDYGVENGFEKTQINISKPEDWRNAPDLQAFAQWVNGSNNPDFLIPLPGQESGYQTCKCYSEIA